MTTIIKVLDDARLWAEQELCSTFKFKVPPKDGAEDDCYEYEREFPKAYIIYPDRENRKPSVTIQYSNSEIKGGRATAQLNLLFAVWNNGSHFNDDADVPVHLLGYDGYRDIWNWIDLALQKILKTEYIGDFIRIKQEEGISVGPIKEDNIIPSYYPYFGASISLRVEYATQQVQDEFI